MNKEQKPKTVPAVPAPVQPAGSLGAANPEPLEPEAISPEEHVRRVREVQRQREDDQA